MPSSGRLRRWAATRSLAAVLNAAAGRVPGVGRTRSSVRPTTAAMADHAGATEAWRSRSPGDKWSPDSPRASWRSCVVRCVVRCQKFRAKTFSFWAAPRTRERRTNTRTTAAAPPCDAGRLLHTGTGARRLVAQGNAAAPFRADARAARPARQPRANRTRGRPRAAGETRETAAATVTEATLARHATTAQHGRRRSCVCGVRVCCRSAQTRGRRQPCLRGPPNWSARADARGPR